jgi:hypothetical protein
MPKRNVIPQVKSGIASFTDPFAETRRRSPPKKKQSIEGNIANDLCDL